MNNLNPRIYVACLAVYNNGYLHGKWILANQDPKSLHDEVKKMLASSPIPYAEEMAIHDYEGFGNMRIEEYTGLETISELANFISEHDELGTTVLAHTNGDTEEARELLEECYHGEYNSEEDFSCYWVHEVNGSEIPEFLRHYIDYAAMARDFFINDFFTIELSGKVHVFNYL